jgi:transposase
MDIMGKRYPKEFRDDAVRLARRLAGDFGVSEASVYNWVKQADIDDGVRPGLTQEEADELREVKRRNRVLEEENLILRRAASDSTVQCNTWSRTVEGVL